MTPRGIDSRGGRLAANAAKLKKITGWERSYRVDAVRDAFVATQAKNQMRQARGQDAKVAALEKLGFSVIKDARAWCSGSGRTCNMVTVAGSGSTPTAYTTYNNVGGGYLKYKVLTNKKHSVIVAEDGRDFGLISLSPQGGFQNPRVSAQITNVILTNADSLELVGKLTVPIISSRDTFEIKISDATPIDKLGNRKGNLWGFKYYDGEMVEVNGNAVVGPNGRVQSIELNNRKFQRAGVQSAEP